MTSACTGEVVVTLAFRGLPVRSAASPKCDDPVSAAIFRPRRRTSTDPSTTTKNSRPRLPSSISVRPAGKRSSSAIAAISPSSRFEHSEKSGTRFSSSTFASFRNMARSYGLASLSSQRPETRDQNSGCGRKPSEA
jgi:hypothetical protein